MSNKSDEAEDLLSANSSRYLDAAKFSDAITAIRACAKAEVLREMVDEVMGASEYLMDGATCRMIAQSLRARADMLDPS